MEIEHRLKTYEAIENARGRPLIVYATSTRPGVSAQMAPDAVREFIDQIHQIPEDQREVDILIHSVGGDALTAWKLMSVLRERFTKVGVLVPFMGFSAATLFAMGADEIVLHPHASLGPIDPQIIVRTPDGNARQFAYEDLAAFIRFLTEDAKLSDQQHKASLMSQLFSSTDPLTVGAARRASSLSSEVGERLLLLHMEPGQQPHQIAENLNKSFFAHGDAISRTRARELKLKVANDDPTLEKLIWDAYLGLESYMELRRPFSALQVFLADAEAALSLKPAAPVALPPNTPAAAAQQVWQQVLNSVVAAANSSGREVDFRLVNAVIESRRAASEFQTHGSVSAVRQPTGDVRVTTTHRRAEWQPAKIPG